MEQQSTCDLPLHTVVPEKACSRHRQQCLPRPEEHQHQHHLGGGDGDHLSGYTAHRRRPTSSSGHTKGHPQQSGHLRHTHCLHAFYQNGDDHPSLSNSFTLRSEDKRRSSQELHRTVQLREHACLQGRLQLASRLQGRENERAPAARRSLPVAQQTPVSREYEFRSRPRHHIRYSSWAPVERLEKWYHNRVSHP